MSAQPRTAAAPSPVHLDIARLIALRAAARCSYLNRPSMVAAARSGEFRSRFRGRGMDFDEARVYQPGDDVRSIDWRVTARSGVPHTKIFREERERPVLFLADLGHSMRFATRRAFKSIVAAEACAFLAWAAVARGDRVGGVLVDGDHHLELKPRGRDAGALRLIQALVDMHEHPERTHRVDGGPDALERLARISRPSSLVIVISDGWGLSELARWSARVLRHSELLFIHVYDWVEASAPPPGRYWIGDQQQRLLLDTYTSAQVEYFEQAFREHRQALESTVTRFGGRYLALATDADLPSVLGRCLGAAGT